MEINLLATCISPNYLWLFCLKTLGFDYQAPARVRYTLSDLQRSPNQTLPLFYFSLQEKVFLFSKNRLKELFESHSSVAQRSRFIGGQRVHLGLMSSPFSPLLWQILFLSVCSSSHHAVLSFCFDRTLISICETHQFRLSKPLRLSHYTWIKTCV